MTSIVTRNECSCAGMSGLALMRTGAATWTRCGVLCTEDGEACRTWCFAPTAVTNACKVAIAGDVRRGAVTCMGPCSREDMCAHRAASTPLVLRFFVHSGGMIRKCAREMACVRHLGQSRPQKTCHRPSAIVRVMHQSVEVPLVGTAARPSQWCHLPRQTQSSAHTICQTRSKTNPEAMHRVFCTYKPSPPLHPSRSKPFLLRFLPSPPPPVVPVLVSTYAC